MAKAPPRSDEEVAAEAMRDIYANVTAARDSWRDYDMRYVTQRIFRAIKEAKGSAALVLFLIPLAGHAQSCIGADQQRADWVHDGPCTATDIGFIDPPRRVHFTKHVTSSEICDVMYRLMDRGYMQR